MTEPSDSPRRILLGRITSAHGIRGEVMIVAHTGAPEDIGRYNPLVDDNGAKISLKVVRVTPKGSVIARIAGVTSRTTAETFRGRQLYVDRQRLPPTEASEYYHADLVGLTAIAPDGATVGRVAAVRNYGAGDLIEIALAGSRTTELLPFTSAFIPEVDIQNGRLVVVLPEQADKGDEAKQT
jgi:16S rRNA processing protein RimM